MEAVKCFLSCLLLWPLPISATPRGFLLGNPTYAACFFKSMGVAASFPSGVFEYWLLGEASGNNRVGSVLGGDFLETTGTVGQTTGKSGNAANWAPSAGTLEWALGFGDIALPLSVSFWINVDNLPVVSANFIGGNDPSDPYVKVTSVGNVVHGNNDDGDLITIALGTLDTWHLVVLTLSGTTASLSVDGGTFSTATFSGPPAGTSVILGTITTLDAAIDELGIWQRALTQQEVSDIWNGGTGRFYVP